VALKARNVDYVYDKNSQITRLTYPDGSTIIDYTREDLGRINEIKRASSTLADYDYVGGRMKLLTYEMGTDDLTATPTYDGAGRMTRLAWARTGATLPDFSYAFDDASNILTKTHEHITDDPTEDYLYDSLHRLTKTTYGHRTSDPYHGFVYDDLGNRLTYDNDGSAITYAANDVNEYTDIDGSTPEYDAAGNLTLDDNSYSYFYDAENRLTKIEDSASAAVATYKYDAFGRRIEKVDSKASKTRRYYYDNRQRVLEEYDNAGTPARQAYFVWGTYVDELLLVNDDADDDADYYACRDHLYSVHVLYNPTTGIAERYDYDAYGQPTIYTADGGDSDWWDGDEDPNNESLINNAYTFTGRRLDTLDSGDLVIMYYRARYYSTNTGRFISRDPLEYVDGMNLYDYVAGHPTRFTDPSGNMGLDIPQITGMCYQYSADVSGFLIRNWKKTILDKEFGMGKVTEDATKEAVEEILNEAHTEEGADLDGEILRLPITGKKECVKPCRCRFRAQIQISNFTIISKHVTRWMDLGWSKKSSTIKPYPFKKADVIIDFDLDLTISLSGFVGVCTMPRPGESRS